MAKEYERTMVCKNCNEVEIGKFDGKWYDVKSDILHTKVCKNPQKFERRSTFPPKQLVDEGVTSELKALREDVELLKDAVSALVKELSFKTGSGQPLAE